MGFSYRCNKVPHHVIDHKNAMRRNKLWESDSRTHLNHSFGQVRVIRVCVTGATLVNGIHCVTNDGVVEYGQSWG